jgi:hypothetical protein
MEMKVTVNGQLVGIYNGRDMYAVKGRTNKYSGMLSKYKKTIIAAADMNVRILNLGIRPGIKKEGRS